MVTGCDLFPGVAVQERGRSPSWRRDGWAASQVPQFCPWPVGKDTTALGAWKRVLDCVLHAQAHHTQAPCSVGQSRSLLACFEARQPGIHIWPRAGVWPACVGLVGEWQGAKGMAIYYASLGTRH